MGDAGVPSLREMVEFQAAQCHLAGSPLYGRILEGILPDLDRGGPVCRVLEAGTKPDPVGSVVELRMLAAVHRIVLDGRAPELAAHYPSAGGRIDHPGDVVAAFVATVEEHQAELLERVHDGLQTNEVGRCVTLVGGYAEVQRRTGLPLRVLEVGTSAGLNLRWDRYAYDIGDRVAGDAASPVRFAGAWVGDPPDLGTAFDVAERRGCDRNPLDATDADDALRLRAAVWPDQLDRHARLTGALVVAAAVPVTIDAADAVEWVTEQLAAPVAGVTTVVVHSIVLQYLDGPARQRFVAAVAAVGARATADAPMAWLRMEPGGEQAELRCTLWPGGGDELLARSGYHGAPVTWLAV